MARWRVLIDAMLQSDEVFIRAGCASPGSRVCALANTSENQEPLKIFSDKTRAARENQRYVRQRTDPARNPAFMCVIEQTGKAASSTFGVAHEKPVEFARRNHSADATNAGAIVRVDRTPHWRNRDAHGAIRRLLRTRKI